METDETTTATLNGTPRDGSAVAPLPPRIPEPLPAYVGTEIAAYCTVSRFNPNDAPGDAPSEPVRVGRLVTPFALELIAQRFGAGRYMLQWHDAGHKYLGRSRIALEAPPALVGEAPWQSVQAPFYPQNAGQMPQSGPYYGAPPTPLDAVLSRIVQPLDAIASRLAQLEARMHAPPPAPAGMTAKDVVDVFQVAATMLKPADPALMETYFKTGMRLAREAAGDRSRDDDNGGGGWPAVIAQLGPGILEALNRMMPPTTPPALPAPANALPAAPNPLREKTVPKWLQALIEEFRRGIAADDDPGFTADWIVRNVPEQFVGQLCEPDAEQTLATYAAVVPELGTDKGKEFAHLVLDELRKERAAEAATEGEPATAQG